MKTITLISILLFSGFTSLQDKTIQESVQGAVDNLFDLSVNEDYAKMAFKIAYTGKDEERNLKDTFNYEDTREASKVKRTSKKIKAFLDISDSHEFGKFEISKNEGIEVYNLEVIFKSGEQDLKTEFTFVKVNGNLLLVEVN